MIQSVISKHFEKLSVKGKIVANEILELGDQVCFMTVRQLSEHANVSTLTVVRTVRNLGFDGYSDFQKSLRQHPPTQNDALSLTAEANAFEIELKKGADLISNARKVYVTGARSAYGFAHYTVYMARMVFDKFQLIAPSGSVNAEDLALMSNGDVIIAFSSRPYSSETVKFIRAAHKLGINTIAITDTVNSPLTKLATVVLKTPIKRGPFLYRMGPFMTTVEHLLETCFEKPNARAKDRIKFFADRVNSIRGYWR
jgi:DNA-binding MurR/RpiR family transcriptional regulator